MHTPKLKDVLDVQIQKDAKTFIDTLSKPSDQITISDVHRMQILSESIAMRIGKALESEEK